MTKYTSFDKTVADMENPASVQAMLVDICVEKCGHFYIKQEITTIMSHCGQILNQIVDLAIYLLRNLKERDI